MGSGITAGTVAVVALNYIFNELGVGSKTAEALGSTPPFVGAEEVANATSKSKQLALMVITGCAIATVDAAGTEHATGHLVIEDGRITAIGAGPGSGERP